MKRCRLAILSGTLSALLCATPLALAAGSDAAHKPEPAKASSAGRLLPAENLSGKILSVKPDQKLIVVQNSDGIPFDMQVTPKTRLTSGNQTLTLQDLAQYQNKDVTLRFIPERRGDVLEWMHIGS